MSNQKIKLSPETLIILRNLAGVNKSLLFRKGNTLYTINESKSIMVKATIAESFESDFAIFEIPRLLAVMSHFSDPELVISEKFLTIQEGKKRLNYTFADPRHINTVDAETFTKLNSVVDKGEIDFQWKNDVFADVNKALQIMGLPEFEVVGDGESVKLRAVDTKNPTGDIYEAELDTTTETFNALFKSENLRFLPLDYTVKYATRGMARFDSEKVTYLVMTEAKKK
jgi:gp45 sliding clamp